MSADRDRGGMIIVTLAATVALAAWTVLAPQSAHGAEASTPDACQLPMLTLPATGASHLAPLLLAVLAIALGTLAIALALIARNRPRYRRRGTRR